MCVVVFFFVCFLNMYKETLINTKALRSTDLCVEELHREQNLHVLCLLSLLRPF